MSPPKIDGSGAPKMEGGGADGAAVEEGGGPMGSNDARCAGTGRV